MAISHIEEKYQESGLFFQSGMTLEFDFRKKSLLKLKEVLIRKEDEIYKALKSDLNKSKTESYMTEYLMVMGQLNYSIKHLRKFMRPKLKIPSLSQFPATLCVNHRPYGVVLIMSPWNYPIELTLTPLVSAIAAGNTVILKPSNYSQSSTQVIKEICGEAFPKGLVNIIEGGHEENQELLEKKFDYIFFTGNSNVGRIVMEKASKNLTPITLELGGKSPTIIESSADLKLTAKRILFGKLLNSGQTCIAPDYLLAKEEIKNSLIGEILSELKNMIPSKEYMTESMAKIITQRHYQRLKKLLEGENIIIPEGEFNSIFDDERLQIHPVIIDEPDMNSPLMKEEIFGPILPIFGWRDEAELFEKFKTLPKPLAAYVFTRDKNFFERVRVNIHSGSIAMNETVLQLAADNAPFGGVGESGMGNYLGEYGFRTFSHEQTVLKKKFGLDFSFRYPPYGDDVLKKLRIFGK